MIFHMRFQFIFITFLLHNDLYLQCQSKNCYLTFFRRTCRSLASIIAMSAVISGEEVSAAAIDGYSYIKEGGDLFRKGLIKQSASSFNEAIRVNPLAKQYLWQRGLSLYFVNDYNGCADQFETDITKNPEDTEEILWDLLCKFQQNNVEVGDAEESVPKGLPADILPFPRSDPRPIMLDVYNLFTGRDQPDLLVRKYDREDTHLQPNDNRSMSNYFYSRLYLSLYYEAIQRNVREASRFVQQALDSPYAKHSRDYMVAVAAGQK